MKRIVLFYEHVNREYDALKRIANEIHQLAPTLYDVEIRDYTFEWLGTVKSLQKRPVYAVVVPFLYSDVPDYAPILPFRKQRDVNCKVFNLHHEQIAAPFNDAYQLPNGTLARNGCIHCAWGKDYARRLRERGVNNNLIVVTGNARLDAICNGVQISRDELAQTYGLDASKKWVLYCEGRQERPMNRESRTKHPVLGKLSEEAYEALCMQELRSLALTKVQFKRLPSSFFEQFELIYRPHPGTIAVDVDYRIKTIADLPVYTWLSQASLVLVWNSTTAFEANVFGVPVLRHEPIKNDSMFRAYGLSSFPVIEDLVQINIEGIERLCSEQKGADYYAPYYGKVDGCSAQRTALAIVDSIERDGVDLESTGLSDSSLKKEYRRMFLRNAIGNTFERLGILRFTKWPKAAYVHLDEKRQLALLDKTTE